MKTQDFKIAVVAPLHKVPTHEYLKCLFNACNDKADVIFVDDSPEQDLQKKLSDISYGNANVYNREFQQKELGDQYEAFKQFHKSSSCKSFGNYMAWKLEYDVIIGLDSDCNVPQDFIDKHIEALQIEGYGWTNPIKVKGVFPRGYPYQERSRKIVANLGLWENVLDINGKDRKDDEPTKCNVEGNLVAECFIPFSGMNWAVWREAMPSFLFLPNFDFTIKDKTYRFRRHDDIWGGYIFQKFMEKRNERMTYGYPIVWHDTIIDAKHDEQEESGMVEFENTFIQAVDNAMTKVESNTYEDMMWQFSKIVEMDWKGTEWESLIKPLNWWANLFTHEIHKVK